MKTTKLVIGILSIVLSVFVLFQGCTVDLADTINQSEVPAGVIGIFIAIILLVAGIIAIATRKNKAGGIVAGVFYLLGGLVGRTGIGTYYEDLIVWSTLCFIFAAVFILGSILFIRSPKQKAVPVSNADSTVVFVDNAQRTQDMPDDQFEYYCEYLLKRKYYFSRIQVPVKTSDRSCDLVAYRKDGTTWVIFCKQDGASVDFETMERLSAAKSEHRAEFAAIMTSTHVSKAIRAYAKEKDVTLFEDLAGNIDED